MSLFAQKAPGIVARLMADFGLTPEQACGVLGNLAHESGGLRIMQEIDPVAGRGGLGWAQWTGSRRAAYETYCRQHGLSASSDEANYGYLAHELRTTQAGAIRAVKGQRTLAAAVAAFERVFERAGVPAIPDRVRWAEEALAAWKASGGKSESQKQSVAPTDGNRPAPAPAVHPGNADVLELQRALARLGYAPGPADGDYGLQTERAVRRFQADHGLSVDGEVGPVTWARIQRELAAKPAA